MTTIVPLTGLPRSGSTLLMHILNQNPAEINLNPGDLCLYRGCDLWHWREVFAQKWYLQAFLHYVNADGAYKDNLYDGRPYLGMQRT